MFRRNFLQTLAGLIPTCLVGCHIGVKHQTELKMIGNKFKNGDKVRTSFKNEEFIGIIHSIFLQDSTHSGKSVFYYLEKTSGMHPNSIHKYEDELTLV